MKTQIPAKKMESGVGGRSHLPTFNLLSPEVVSRASADTDREDSALHPDRYNLANVPISAKSPGNNQRNTLHGSTGRLPIQAKLTISEPNDKYEQEADRVAQQVVQKLNSPKTVQSSRTTAVQRDAMQERGKDKLRMKLPTQQSTNERETEETQEIESSIQQMQGDGKPITEGTRLSLERAFGKNFSKVRIHTNSQSHHLNRSLQSSAFTTGQDIFFGQEAYNPDTQDGLELLSHELTHVVQQGGLITNIVQRGRVAHPAKRVKYNEDVLSSDSEESDSEESSSDESSSDESSSDESSSDESSSDEDFTEQDADANLSDDRLEHQERDDHEYALNIPRKKLTQPRRIGGKLYQFFNRGDGTLDFQAPKGMGQAAKVYKDVQIAKGSLIKGTTLPLKQPKGANSQHFRAANTIAGTTGARNNSGSSPPNQTWHHHKDEGRMQLLDAKVHAAFPHVGGKKLWGTS